MALTVEQARETQVCRICEKPISGFDKPQGYAFAFRELIYPCQVTFNFGEEFAHTKCLPIETNDAKDEAQKLSSQGPQPGQIYRHYKGGLYTVLARAIKEDTLEPLVIYQSNKKGSVWARTLENFTETIDGKFHRFYRETD